MDIKSKNINSIFKIKYFYFYINNLLYEKNNNKI